MSNGTELPRSGEAAETPAQLESHVACSVCHHEIPVSAALWRESSDYVAHFCGLQCFDRWRNQRSGP
jgi:hypothetical protein